MTPQPLLPAGTASSHSIRDQIIITGGDPATVAAGHAFTGSRFSSTSRRPPERTTATACARSLSPGDVRLPWTPAFAGVTRGGFT